MGKRISVLLAVISQVIIFFTCDNYEFPESPYPRIETMPVKNITASGVRFQAKITQIGRQTILDHGFLWGFTSDLSLAKSEKMQLGEFTGDREFAGEVSYGLYKDTTYYMKAYVSTDAYFVFGKTMTFKSMGSSPVVITTFSPTEGTWGDTITVEGRHFGTRNENNHVAFGESEALVLSSTDSTLTCIVPDDIPDKTLPIFLTAFDQKTQSSMPFIFLTPTVESFSPHMGTFGDVVEIRGTNFHSSKEKNIVKFNEHAAEVVEASSTLLSVKVPTAIDTKLNQISVTMNLQSATAEGSYDILPPAITGLSQTTGSIGSSVQIFGNNFNPAAAGNEVILGGQAGIVSSASKDRLTVYISQGIYDARSFAIDVVVAEQRASSADVFTLQDAWIRKADIPGSRGGATAFSINGFGYVGLGSSTDTRFWRFDPADNSWTETASFPGQKRAHAVSFVIDGKAYVGLGGYPAYVNDFWRYDPQADSWESIAEFPAEVAASIGLSANGKGYVVTSTSMDNFWEYDAGTDVWNQEGDVPIGFESWHTSPASGFVIDNNLFIYMTVNGSTAPHQFMKYDFSYDGWEILSQHEGSEHDITRGTMGFSVGGYGYIRGDYEIYKYDPLSNLWETGLEAPPGPRANSIAFEINGKAYLGTSYNGKYDLWEYDPAFE